MNKTLTFVTCRICLEEKSFSSFLLEPLGTEYAGMVVGTCGTQSVSTCSSKMSTCGDCAVGSKKCINCKTSVDYNHKRNTVFSEPDSGFQDLFENIVDEGEDKCAIELTSGKKAKGRPPKRYDTQFQCDRCCFVTVYAKYFRKHMSLAHQDEQPRIFKCLHCPEAYVEERFLREHVKHIHDCIPRRPKFICAECGKGFPKQSHLRRHSYVHNPNEKPFLCEYCPMRFVSQSSLTRHIEGTHNVNKPHACEECGKAFGHIYGLKAHKIRMHWKEVR
ncbi:zinc finger protein 254-like isoform X1 [Anastrepha ludens]|uniref:zinc finger protein 254-like isoform X1 n=2 Tax=Anastrepha ludens TaxID=28586 RepID=UPI0023B030EA|nr:zinc finger protein 254-like isoform X1 [Anastrepha ludens]